MPLAFGTILGGMTTLIGTPPNLIVSDYRAETGAGAFRMFDFTPVGGIVALAGVAFIALVGWRLVPRREPAGAEGFDTGSYITEVRIPEGNKAVGRTLGELEQQLDESEAQIVGMVRSELRVLAPRPGRVLRAGDVLVLEAEPQSLSSVLSSLGLSLDRGGDGDGDASEARDASPGGRDSGGDGQADPEQDDTSPEDGDLVLQELVAMPDSALIGRNARDIDLRSRYGVNLLALSRQGQRSIKRLRSTRMRAGDVLLMQGARDSLSAFSREYGCVPLAPRAIGVPDKGKVLLAVGIMAGAVAAAGLGWLSAAVAFACGTLAYMALRIVPLRSVYASVDWSVVVLLAAMMPVADVMADTGAADLIARLLLTWFSMGSPVVALVIIMVVTMVLSDLMNNAATAAVMCQIALSSAGQLQVNPDSFLMAVALGASCAFLTPIAHQNNTLILGPGGFHFGDYWRLGLPMEIIVITVGVPLLLRVWPLH
jgi:di/tricarboxylate transporter